MKEIEDDEFGKKIVLIAKEKFGSQKLMGEALGLKQSAITGWVKGRAYPSLAVLKELCLKAEISLDWLVLGKDMSNEIDHHEFVRIILYAEEWAKKQGIKPNDDLLVSIYLSFENRRKDYPTLTIKDFFKDFGDIFKNIEFH